MIDIPDFSDSTAVEARDVRVVFGSNVTLNDVTFSIPKGSLVGLVGPNGAGKSTLLKALVGTVPLDSGRVLIMGKNPSDARGSVGYVPQVDLINWHFPVTVAEVVAMRRGSLLSRFGLRRSEERERVRSALERVNLWERRDSMVRELSGGQRQRTFVARALAQDAEVLLLDEAFSGVDVGSQENLVMILMGMCLEGKTVVLSTHDLTNLARTFDKVICLNGHVCAYGSPEEAFTPEILEEMYGVHGTGYAN